MRKIVVLVGIIALALASNASALTISLTLPEFSSPAHDTGFYYDEYLVGTFNFDLTGQEIVSATISGSWGNSLASTTANNLLFADTLQVANTYDYSPDPYYNGPTPWSFNFVDFTVLNDGVLDFKTVQLTEFVIRLDDTTLEITTRAVPEPSTFILFGGGLLGLVGLNRRRKA